jgi:succinate dehydrogenase / fumarate reductase cytochrome b subunit
MLKKYIYGHGWMFIVSWVHRITGIFLVLFVWWHFFTLSALKNPIWFDRIISTYNNDLMALLKWALAIPVLFHALNGLRIVAYESYGARKKMISMKWILFFTGLYSALLALFMINSDQHVTPSFYWIVSMSATIGLTSIVCVRIWQNKMSFFWKLHRASGIFLLIAIPAHILFMHLSPEIGHNSEIILARIKLPYVIVIDWLIAFALLYHCAYGLISMSKDYFQKHISISIAYAFVFILTSYLFAVSVQLLLFV